MSHESAISLNRFYLFHPRSTYIFYPELTGLLGQGASGENIICELICYIKVMSCNFNSNGDKFEL